jgi:hypothetical protein
LSRRRSECCVVSFYHSVHVYRVARQRQRQDAELGRAYPDIAKES